MTDISLHTVSKRYDNGFEAVKNLTLRLESGSFTVLLGPSGCGKTTTLRMIAGLEEISSGDLFFGAERVNDLPPKDRDIGMVFQNYALYPHLSVYENIAFPLRLRRESKSVIDEKVRAAALTVELMEILDRKPKQLSGGQRQRVALARAIVRKPRVFLFDEPLSNLDARLRQQMRVEITRLHRLVGATSVYVTHDQSEAMTMADRIVVMRDGELQQVGTPTEVYANPANRFVAGFIGSPGINFFEGELRLSGGEIIFQENQSDSVLRLPKQDFVSFSEHSGQKVTFALRPEHLRISRFVGALSEKSIRGTLRRIEFLGHERLFYVETTEGADLKIIRSTEMPDVAEGDVVQLDFRAEDCLFFGENGQRF